MTLIKKNPRHHLFPEISSLFSDNWTPEFFKSEFPSPIVPSVNVKENDNAFILELAAPGKKKEDFDLQLENNVLTISSESKDKKEETKEKMARREFSYESFSRSFTLPKYIDQESIKAKYENGILNIMLPKLEVSSENNPTNITVK